MAEPWDQRKGEPEEAYARFLLYRNLGMSRSMRKTYFVYLRDSDGYTGDGKRLSAPNSWFLDSRAWEWRKRANAWDIRNLHAYGGRLAVLQIQAVTAVARKNVRMGRRMEPGSKGYADLLDSIRLVAEVVTPEIIRAIQERDQQAAERARESADTPAIAARHDDGDDPAAEVE